MKGQTQFFSSNILSDNAENVESIMIRNLVIFHFPLFVGGKSFNPIIHGFAAPPMNRFFQKLHFALESKIKARLKKINRGLRMNDG